MHICAKCLVIYMYMYIERDLGILRPLSWGALDASLVRLKPGPPTIEL